MEEKIVAMLEQVIKNQEKMQQDIDVLSSQIEEIKKDLMSVELITSKNWHDIAILKSLK